MYFAPKATGVESQMTKFKNFFVCVLDILSGPKYLLKLHHLFIGFYKFYV